MKSIDYIKNLNSDKSGESRGIDTSLKDEQAEKENEVDIYKYDDVQGGVSTKKLDIGLWFIRKKHLFRKLFILLLIIVSAVSWTYSIYSFAYYVAVGMNEDQIMVNDMVNNNIISHDYLVQVSAQNISASPVSVFPLGEKKYDLLAEIENPNFRHWVDFEYCFYTNTENIVCNHGFLMPGEKKYVIELAKEIDSGSNNVGFMVDKLSWRRINLHKYPDWKNFAKDHLNILIKDINFKSTTQSGLSDKLGYNTLDFAVSNKTPYNYWSVDFNILLRRQGKVVSINKYNLQELISGEERKIEISWPGKIRNISDVIIEPVINILDQNNYIDFDVGSGLEK